MERTAAQNIKTVLIVDDEKLFLSSLKEGLLAFADEFSVITAGNGREALEKLNAHDVDLVVTDLKMPEMDGFQLLGQMVKDYPHIPVIVMTAFGTPEIENSIQELEVFDYLEKPIDLALLADKIRHGINKHSDGHLKGIMLFSFLQLLQIEKKTCVLKVKSGERKGVLYFSKGELIDAAYDRLVGETAASEIVCWDEAEIEIVKVSKKLNRRIERPLQNILMEAAQKKDEEALGEASFETAADDDFSAEMQAAFLSENAPEFHDRQVLAMPDAKSFPADTAGDKPDKYKNPEEKEKTNKMANNVNQSLEELMSIEGATAVALVDSESGMALGAAGGGVNLDVAAAGNSEVVRSKNKVMGSLGLKDRIEDILISLGSQYHLIRPLANHSNLFFYLVLNRAQSNLAMARFKLSDVEGRVEV
ncbi:MAG TPA: response regulator [Pyrinomonadaceae bacterium]|jgi:CheY-like chemotaxis protein